MKSEIILFTLVILLFSCHKIDGTFETSKSSTNTSSNIATFGNQIVEAQTYTVPLQIRQVAAKPQTQIRTLLNTLANKNCCSIVPLKAEVGATAESNSYRPVIPVINNHLQRASNIIRVVPEQEHVTEQPLQYPFIEVSEQFYIELMNATQKNSR